MSTTIDLSEPGAASGASPRTAPRATSRATWIGFAAVLSASILNILDSTLVNVAGPSIRADLGLSTSSLEWVAAAYTLAMAVGLVVGARLGDMVGRKRLFLIGLTGFVLTSVLCSVAWSPGALIGARGLQGVTAALVLPQCFGLLRDVFGPADVGKAFGVMGPVIGLSTVLGPVVAGLLIKADLFGTDWRGLFWTNVPIGLFAILAGRRHLPSIAPAQSGLRLDLVGTALLATAAFMLVFPLVDGRTLGWPAWIFAMLAASLPLFGAFFAHQRSRLSRGQDPLVEVTILRKRSYVSGVGFLLFFFGSLIGFSLTVGLFLQIGLGFSATRASLYLAALAVGSFVGAGVGSWAAEHVGRPILHVGLSIMAAGTLVLYVALRTAETIGFLQLAPGLAIFGLGMGMIFVPLFSIVLGEVEDREVGSASGLLTSVEQLGTSLGVAILGTVFFGWLRLEDGGPAAAMAAGRHLLAVEHTLLWVLGAIAAAWILGWFLPKQAKTAAH